MSGAMTERPLPSLWDGAAPPQVQDVRFIGAVAGRYALSARRNPRGGSAEVFACRLCSISTRMAVVVAPVLGNVGSGVTAHFDVFGILRGRIVRTLNSGFAIDIDLNEDGRGKLAAKISWYKRRVLEQVPDRREHKRFLPRDPRSTLTFGDGATVPCFIIDYSRSGVAISAEVTPELGTPVAVGRIVGRVVRHLDVGFAIRFVELQELEFIETRLAPL